MLFLHRVIFVKHMLLAFLHALALVLMLTLLLNLMLRNPLLFLLMGQNDLTQEQLLTLVSQTVHLIGDSPGSSRKDGFLGAPPRVSS